MVSPMPCSAKTRIVLPASVLAGPARRLLLDRLPACGRRCRRGIRRPSQPRAKSPTCRDSIATAPGGSARPRDSARPPPRRRRWLRCAGRAATAPPPARSPPCCRRARARSAPRQGRAPRPGGRARSGSGRAPTAPRRCRPAAPRGCGRWRSSAASNRLSEVSAETRPSAASPWPGCRPSTRSKSLSDAAWSARAMLHVGALQRRLGEVGLERRARGRRPRRPRRCGRGA